MITQEMLLTIKAMKEAISSKKDVDIIEYQKSLIEVADIYYLVDKDMTFCLYMALKSVVKDENAHELSKLDDRFDIDSNRISQINSLIDKHNIQAISYINDGEVCFYDGYKYGIDFANQVAPQYKDFVSEDEQDINLNLLDIAERQYNKKQENKLQDSFVLNRDDLLRIKAYREKMRDTLSVARSTRRERKYFDEMYKQFEEHYYKGKTPEEKKNAICLLAATNLFDNGNDEINTKLDQLGIDNDIRNALFGICNDNSNLTVIKGVNKEGFTLYNNKKVALENMERKLEYEDEYQDYVPEKGINLNLNLLYFADTKFFKTDFDKDIYQVEIKGENADDKERNDSFYVEGRSPQDLNSKKIFKIDIKEQLRQAEHFYYDCKHDSKKMWEEFDAKAEELEQVRQAQGNIHKETINKMMPIYLTIDKAKGERTFLSYFNPYNWYKYSKENKALNLAGEKLREVGVDDYVIDTYKSYYYNDNPEKEFDSLEWDGAGYTPNEVDIEEEIGEQIPELKEKTDINIDGKEISAKQELNKDIEINITNSKS